MQAYAIRIQNLSKRYRIGPRARYRALRDSLAGLLLGPWRRGRNATTQRSQYIWALRNISLEVQPGEVVGIIGPNGAGKTTLLKIIARITEPTEGTVEIRGRVGSLLEVGTGFHPELTGRENIYLNGAILGMKKKEIDRKFNEIVQFAEIEPFIDTPVKYYSSGMFVRLAFAVAAHLEPEILLVDEVLAVGDIAFQKRCIGKMKDVSRTGRTVLFVSHNMQAVRYLTQRAILLHQGSIVCQGATPEVIDQYQKMTFHPTLSGYRDLREVPRDGGDRKIELVSVTLRDEHGHVTNTFPAGDPIYIEIRFRSHLHSDEMELGYSVRTLDGIMLFTSSTSDNGKLYHIEPGEYRIETVMRPNHLRPGRYYLSLGSTCGVLRDLIYEAILFEITPSDKLSQSPILTLPGYVYFPYAWSIPERVTEPPAKPTLHPTE